MADMVALVFGKRLSAFSFARLSCGGTQFFRVFDVIVIS